MTFYIILLVVVVAGLGLAVHYHAEAKRAREEEAARRKSLEREARLLERRKKPRGPR